MKTSRSTKASRPIPKNAPTASTPSAPAGGAFVELTADTVTDDTIQAMLRHARSHCDPDIAVMCCKALRPPATITTSAETATRRAARRGCARHINERMRSWLQFGTSEDRAYVALVGLGPDAPREGTGRVSRPDGSAAHPLCWECNAPIEWDEEHRTVSLRDRGQVTVHLQCVSFIDAAELDERGPRVGVAVKPQPPRSDDESLFGGPWFHLEDTIDIPNDDP